MSEETRRTALSSALGDKFRVAGWSVDARALEISNGEETRRLEAKIMDLLVCLANRPGEALTREELEAEVWNDVVVGYGSLTAGIIKLRKAFGDDPKQPTIIRTIPKVGYQLIAAVDQILPEDDVIHGAETCRHVEHGPDAATDVPPETAKRRRMAIMASVIVVAIATVGLAVWQFGRPAIESASTERMAYPLPDRPSIAVLPFTNLSSGSEQEYFADGLTDDLITDLSKVPNLFVISRNSTFVYKGTPVTVRRVAEDLGVRYVLEGSVRRSGDQIRVNAQLIDALTGGHLWADRFNGNAADVFAVQDEFVGKIVSALELQLTDAERETLKQGRTDNIDARLAFQKGWEHYLNFTPEDNAKALGHLQTAIRLDPDYGHAYAAIALVAFRAFDWRWHEALGRTFRDVENDLDGFLRVLDEHQTPLAHVARALAYLSDERYQEGLTEATRAIAIDPNDPEAHIAMALAMISARKVERALRFIRIAVRLNPAYPSHYALARGIAHFMADDYALAISVLREALNRNPQASELAAPLAAAYARNGQRQEAHSILLLWRPDLKPSDLDFISEYYHFPYRWSLENRDVRTRLFDGLRIATLPQDIDVSSLIKLLQGDDFFERLRAVRTLGWFGSDAKLAVPELIVTLADEEEEIRKQAVISLGKIGVAASAAISHLRAMQSEPLLGHYARESLQQITRR